MEYCLHFLSLSVNSCVMQFMHLWDNYIQLQLNVTLLYITVIDIECTFVAVLLCYVCTIFSLFRGNILKSLP